VYRGSFFAKNACNSESSFTYFGYLEQHGTKRTKPGDTVAVVDIFAKKIL
jgi:hypothetical protein